MHCIKFDHASRACVSYPDSQLITQHTANRGRAITCLSSLDHANELDLVLLKRGFLGSEFNKRNVGCVETVMGRSQKEFRPTILIFKVF